MPLHGYSTDRRPPTVLDHLLAHPYSFAVAVAQVTASALVTVALFRDYGLVSSAMDLPPALIGVLAVMLTIGGVNVMRGLLDDSDDLRRGFHIERGGLILSGTGWLAYAVSVILGNPRAALSWAFALCLFGAMVLRGWAGRREETRIAKELRAHTQ